MQSLDEINTKYGGPLLPLAENEEDARSIFGRAMNCCCVVTGGLKNGCDGPREVNNLNILHSDRRHSCLQFDEVLHHLGIDPSSIFPCR